MKKCLSVLLALALPILLVVVGSFLGSIFVFGTVHWNADLPREDCITVDSKFVEAHLSRDKSGWVEQIRLDCINGESYFIDDVCITEDLCDAVSSMPTRTPVHLLLHPNSHSIVELSVAGRKLMRFDNSTKQLQSEIIGFVILGLCMYFGAFIGIALIIMHFVGKAKKKATPQEGTIKPHADMFLPDWLKTIGIFFNMTAAFLLIITFVTHIWFILIAVFIVGGIGTAAYLCRKNQTIRIIDDEHFEYTTFLGRKTQHTFSDIKAIRINKDSYTLFMSNKNIHIEACAFISDELKDKILKTLRALKRKKG